MRTETPPSRTTGFSATTTLVALMAVATTCSAIGMPKSAHAQAECRALMMDNQSVRHVAAAVAAIARDLFGSDQVEAALSELPWTEQYLPVIESRLAVASTDRTTLSPPLIEQLLDLPPPVC